MKMSKKLCPGKICVLDLELRVQVMSYGIFSSLLCDKHWKTSIVEEKRSGTSYSTIQEAWIYILFWDNEMAIFQEKNEDILSVKPRER